MLTNLKIIKANERDVDGIVKVEQSSWLETYPNKAYGVTYSDVKARFSNEYLIYRKTQLLKDIKDPSGKVKLIVAIIDEEVVGYIRGSIGENFNDLIEIYILSVYRGLGIGKRLIDELF